MSGQTLADSQYGERKLPPLDWPERTGKPCCPGKASLTNSWLSSRDRAMGEALGYKGNRCVRTGLAPSLTHLLVAPVLVRSGLSCLRSFSLQFTLLHPFLRAPAFWPCFRPVPAPAAACHGLHHLHDPTAASWNSATQSCQLLHRFPSDSSFPSFASA